MLEMLCLKFISIEFKTNFSFVCSLALLISHLLQKNHISLHFIDRFFTSDPNSRILMQKDIESLSLRITEAYAKARENYVLFDEHIKVVEVRLRQMEKQLKIIEEWKDQAISTQEFTFLLKNIKELQETTRKINEYFVNPTESIISGDGELVDVPIRVRVKNDIIKIFDPTRYTPASHSSGDSLMNSIIDPITGKIEVPVGDYSYIIGSGSSGGSDGSGINNLDNTLLNTLESIGYGQEFLNYIFGYLIYIILIFILALLINRIIRWLTYNIY